MVLDPCDPNPCSTGTCTVQSDTYSCTCPSGYEDNGTTCVLSECNLTGTWAGLVSQEVSWSSNAAGYIRSGSTTLYNYDKDRDLVAGLLIQKGGVGPGEPDSVKHQVWRSGALSESLSISGTVTIDIWAALKNLYLRLRGEGIAFLRD